MLNQVEEAKEKWGGAHNAIDVWLHERQSLLVQYCELAGLPPFQREKGALPTAESIRDFCELLVDYVSAGHFEVYDKIADESKQNGSSLADSLYPKISDTTDHALTFNDAYADLGSDAQLDKFDQHLSQLGQQLEERFEMEDQLIHALHTEHL